MSHIMRSYITMSIRDEKHTLFHLASQNSLTLNKIEFNYLWNDSSLNSLSYTRSNYNKRCDE